MAASLAAHLPLTDASANAIDTKTSPSVTGTSNLRRIAHQYQSPSLSSARESSISIADLEGASQEYLYDCDLRLQSPHTVATRRIFIRNLIWFLRHRDYEKCGTSELRQFFYYLLHGHDEPNGRFGHRHLKQAVRPITLKDYYISLRSFFDWLVQTGEITSSPFAHIPKPQVREAIKPPLSSEQIQNLLKATEESTHSARDKAILLWLLDTGCRASETVSIQQEDLDLKNRCCLVLGKGNKHRTVYFGDQTREALENYLQEAGRLTLSDSGGQATNSPVFVSRQGSKPLTRYGLLQLLERLGQRAGIKGNCSPHALRRSFAVQTLRNGANVFSVQAMLGHSDLEMTRRYCALAQTDVEAQHRQFSPVDRLNA
jgi:integrase/recombinase XerD